MTAVSVPQILVSNRVYRTGTTEMADSDVEKAKAEASNLAASVEKLKQEIEAMGNADEIRNQLKANAKLNDELKKLLKKA